MNVDKEPPEKLDAEPAELPEGKPLEPVRYHDLDALRAYAMLLGILLHAVLSFNFTPIWPAQDKFQDADFQVINNSIHGFRMQLFFLVSGFFTCMMWLKRGSIGLVWHRFKRILLPLFLFSLVIIPALTHMPELAAKKREAEKQQAEEQGKVRERTSRTSIWDASKSGDLNRVRELIDSGANINRPKPGLIRPTPLHNASAAGHPEIVTLLLKSGADIDAGDIGGSTPLHWAALMGQADSVRLLMEAGASPDRKNREGETPLQSAELEQGMTQLAIGVLQMPVPIKDVMAGRKEVKALLLGGKIGLWGRLDAFVKRNYLTDIFGSKVIFHHLWFLYDLFLLCLGFALVLGSIKLLVVTIRAVVRKFLPRLAGRKLPGRWKLLPPITGGIGLGLLAFFFVFETYRAQEEMGTGEFGPQTAVFLNATPLPSVQVVPDDIVRTLRRKGLTDEAVTALRNAGISEKAIEAARIESKESGGRLKRKAAEELASSNSLPTHMGELWSHLQGLPSHLKEEEDRNWRTIPRYLGNNTLIARVPLEGFGFPPKPAWWKLWYYALYFLIGAILFKFRGLFTHLRFAWPVFFGIALLVLFMALTETRKPVPGFLEGLKGISTPLEQGTSGMVEWFNGEDGITAAKRGWKLTSGGFLLTTYSWLMILGFIGLFKLLCSKPRRWIRFVSNSSYWLYLAHMPLVDVLQIWVSDWGVGSEHWDDENKWILISLKLGFVCLASTAILLGSYFLIQYTWISTLLNGRRKALPPTLRKLPRTLVEGFRQRIFRKKEVGKEEKGIKNSPDHNENASTGETDS